APVKERSAQQPEAADRPLQQCPDGRLGVPCPRQSFQVALDDGGRRVFGHGQDPRVTNRSGSGFQFLCPPPPPRERGRRDTARGIHLAWPYSRHRSLTLSCKFQENAPAPAQNRPNILVAEWRTRPGSIGGKVMRRSLLAIVFGALAVGGMTLADHDEH